MAEQDPPYGAEPVVPGRRPPAGDEPPAPVTRPAAPWIGADRPSARRPPAAAPTPEPVAGPAEGTHRAPAAAWTPPPRPEPAADAEYRPAASPARGWRRLAADPRRQLLLAGLVAVAVLVGGLGYLAATRDGGPRAVPAPTGAAALPAVPPAAPPPDPSSAPPPTEPTASADEPAPPPEPPATTQPTTQPTTPPTTRPTTRPTSRPPAARPPERRTPERIGPASLNGFQMLLVQYCRKRGEQAAALINGRGDTGDDAADGTWMCVSAARFTTLDLDDACRDRFGGTAQARQTVRGDARTVRCFDS